MRRITSIGYGTTFALAVSLAACSSAPRPGFVCPGTVAGLQADEVMAPEVEHCLGKPDKETHGQGGRFSYVYDLKDGITVSFLFSSAGRMLSMDSPAKEYP